MIQIPAHKDLTERKENISDPLKYEVKNVVLEDVVGKFIAISADNSRHSRGWHLSFRDHFSTDKPKPGKSFFPTFSFSFSTVDVIRQICLSDNFDLEEMLIWVDDITFDLDGELLSISANTRNIIRDIYEAAHAVVIDVEFQNYTPIPKTLSEYTEWIKRKDKKPLMTSAETQIGHNSQANLDVDIKNRPQNIPPANKSSRSSMEMSSSKFIPSLFRKEKIANDDVWMDLDTIFAIAEWTSLWTVFPVVVSKQVYLSIAKQILSWSDFVHYITIIRELAFPFVPNPSLPHYLTNTTNRVMEMNSWREERLSGMKKKSFAQWIHRARNYGTHSTADLVYIVLGLVDSSYYDAWAVTQPCPKHLVFPSYRTGDGLNKDANFHRRATAAIILHDKNMSHLLSLPTEPMHDSNHEIRRNIPSWVVRRFLRSTMSQLTLQLEPWHMVDELFPYFTFNNDMFKVNIKKSITYSSLRLPAIEIDQLSDCSLLCPLTDVISNPSKHPHVTLLDFLEQVGFNLGKIRETLAMYDSFSREQRIAFILETLEDPLNGIGKEYSVTGESLASVCLGIMKRASPMYTIESVEPDSDEDDTELKEDSISSIFDLKETPRDPGTTENPNNEFEKWVYQTIFRTPKGYLGWMDIEVRKRKLFLFRVAGFPVPVVLEHLPSGEYRYIGYAYLHGFMPGQKVAWDSMKVETITLV
jgi:hypothetical protein